MATLNFYIGTLDKDTLKREVTDKQVMAVITACFDNFIVEKVAGVYTMQNSEHAGEAITEDTFKVTLLISSNHSEWSTDRIKNVCKFIKNMLNQETVTVERVMSRVDFE